MLLKHLKWALLWALFILILCAIPGSDLPEVSMINFDKLVHASLFFILSILSIRGLKTQSQFKTLSSNNKIIALFSCVIYGGLLELAQGWYFIERSADIYDFIANSIGCLIGLQMYSFMEKYLFNKVFSS